MNDILFVISAFALGALHALEPGHGKTVVAAYLIGSKGRVRDAIALGGVVTFTHTFSIIVLGVLTAVAAAYFVPETVHEVMEVLSGLLVLAVGLWMVNERIVKGRTGHGHDHGHEHADERSQAPAARRLPASPAMPAVALAGAAVTHAHGSLTHAHPLPASGMHYHRDGRTLAYVSGEGEEPGHGHPHARDHQHGDRHADDQPAHDHSHAHEHGEGHEHAEGHQHSEGHDHDHGLGVHRHGHLPPAGERASLFGLVTLGVSGGIVPCPAALALLLAAAASGNILGGVSLVVVFSLGLAAVLIAIGIALVKAADVVTRRFGARLDGDSKLARRASMASAVLVTALGVFMTAHAVLHVAGVDLPI